MRRILLFTCIMVNTVIGTLFAQVLPPKAKALYDSAYAQDPSLVTYASNNGAKIIATPDGNSFYIQWFPSGAVPKSTPLVVSLPGSHCNAFMEFKSWHPRAQLHGCGIIALQWYRYQPNPPYDYFPDDTLYSYLDSSLTRITYPSAKALLHGFSRGGARSYAMVFYDIQKGRNYFCTTMANSGDADLQYPLYDSIDSGVYGPNFFAGKHWTLFCGGKDAIVGCAKMASTKTWLQSQGASVDIFIQDSNLDHDGFQLQSSFAYKDSILNNYLLCYSGTLSTGQEPGKSVIRLSPNPFTSQTILSLEDPTGQTGNQFKNATLTVYNAYGQQIKQIENIFGKTITLNRDNLSPGFYFIHLKENNKIFPPEKLILTDN